MRLIAIVLTAALLAAPAFAQERKPGATVSHGLTLLEDLKYPADFKRLDYVNPDAPKEVRCDATASARSIRSIPTS